MSSQRFQVVTAVEGSGFKQILENATCASGKCQNFQEEKNDAQDYLRRCGRADAATSNFKKLQFVAIYDRATSNSFFFNFIVDV